MALTVPKQVLMKQKIELLDKYTRFGRKRVRDLIPDFFFSKTVFGTLSHAIRLLSFIV